MLHLSSPRIYPFQLTPYGCKSGCRSEVRGRCFVICSRAGHVLFEIDQAVSCGPDHFSRSWRERRTCVRALPWQ